MTQVVQAKCPHCQNMLRIPADWLARPMRCKFCKQVIQAKASSASAASAAAGPAAVTEPAAEPPPRRKRGDIFEFDDDTAVARTPLPRRPAKRGGGWLVVAGAVGVVALAAGLAFIFAGPQLRGLFGAPDDQHAHGNGDDGDSQKKKSLGSSKGLFPRRALLINVNNYWLLNPVHYGSPQSAGYPGSSTAVLASRLAGAPLYFPATQITEVSDSALQGAITPSKQVIENAIADFVGTARDQDRLLILFAGHAVEIDKEAYLVPFEGNKEDAKTLIPLSWVYDKLGGCKARQKILVIDAFRFPPARGFELPGTGAMTEDFDAKLAAPPAGLQVWTSCVKEQQSIEFDGGSVFLQCFCHALQDRLGGFAQPDEAIPIETVVAKVNQRVKELLAKTEYKQESRLSGSAPDGGAPYDPSVPLPPKLVLRQPEASQGGDKAGAALVNNILGEMRRIPPMKPSLKAYMENMRAETLPAFSKKVMDFYTADYKTWEEMEARLRTSPGKQPLREAVLEAKKALDQTNELVARMRQTLSAPITEKGKAEFLTEQKEPAMAIFQMEEALAVLTDAAEKRKDEPSKRWQAHFDYATARLLARLVYMDEYNYILGDIRGDRLPTLEGDNTGWRLGFKSKLSTNENKAKTRAKELSRLWKKIADDHPGTPWALLAQREALYAIGLQWRLARE